MVLIISNALLSQMQYFNRFTFFTEKLSVLKQFFLNLYDVGVKLGTYCVNSFPTLMKWLFKINNIVA